MLYIFHLAPSLSINLTTIIRTNNNGNISNTTSILNKISAAVTIPVSSRFIGLTQIGNGSHWLKAGERILADFLPLLPSGGAVKVGLIDCVIKIVGGAVTFGLIAFALRRCFERKYTH